MELKPKMKTPISYYGGKQLLAKKIINSIPDHNLYCEPFFGGGAVFFAKEPSNVEVVNDTNSELINFYKVVSTHFEALKALVEATLHSRDAYRQATVIYNHPDMFTTVQRAWSVWVLSSQTFASSLENSWGFSVGSASTTLRLSNKKANFTTDLKNRLSRCTFENTDAIAVIKRFDRVDSFFYLDPPYFNSDCGHYDGYSEQDFMNLLDALANIKGKFLLSSYPSTLLQKYIKAKKWNLWSVEKGVTINAKSGYLKRKTECLTSNYEL